MELYEIKNGLDKAHLLIDEYRKSAQIDEKLREIEGLSYQTMQDDFWDDPTKAKKIYDELNDIKKITDEYERLCQSLNSLDETYTLVKETDDQEFQTILESDYQDFEQRMGEFEKILLLSGKYDSANAIVEIHPGAGGTESQDWAEMLYRMYQRYCSSKDFKIEVLDYLDGDVAGIKSVTFLVKGKYAYGHLKAEKGVHRLVRISPFDSSKRRHTSFASIDVIPELDDTIEIDIKPEDLRIDTYRASGAGGQHINKTDSAVRITHLPTGIVATSQDGRSQHDNRDKAMKALVARVYDYFQSQQTEAIDSERKSKVGTGDRAEKIRTYNYPQNRVTDHRIGLTIQQLDRIIEGKLDDIITALINEDQRLKLEGQK